jgi:hypothetical protein
MIQPKQTPRHFARSLWRWPGSALRGAYVAIALLALGMPLNLADAADAPVLTTLCELRASPESFDRKLVEVRSMATSGRHGAGLYDDSCTGFVLFRRPDDDDSPRWRGTLACGTGLADDPKSLRWENAPPRPFPTKLVNDQSMIRFDHALADRHPEDRSCLHRAVTATVVGRFHYEPCKVIWTRTDDNAVPKPILSGGGMFDSIALRLDVQSVREVVVGVESDCWKQAEKARRTKAQ